MLILGLTGNIGCGKSSISDIFKCKNIKVIDADVISREIYEDKSLLDIISSTFGCEVINKEGKLDRKKLSYIVFNDNEKLVKLNSITHPVIKQKIIDEIKRYKKNEIIVVDAALLIEGKFLDIVDKTLVVVCDREIQIDRIQKRDKCSREEVISKINAQMQQEEKIKYADYIINNSESMAELRQKIEIFLDEVKENYFE